MLEGSRYHSICDSEQLSATVFISHLPPDIFQLRLCVYFGNVLEHLIFYCLPVSHHKLGILVRHSRQRQMLMQASLIFYFLQIYSFSYISSYSVYLGLKVATNARRFGGHRSAFGECDLF